MSGSYQHCVDKDFNPHNSDMMNNQIENLGDAHEAIEKMALMIKYLSDGNPMQVYQAECHSYRTLYPHYKPKLFREWNEERLRDI